MRLTYKLNDRFSVFALAEHYGQSANSFLDIPMSRNRYFGGVEIWVSRPPDSATARNHHSKLPEESDELKAPAPEDKQ
jgi:hypothetical protein